MTTYIHIKLIKKLAQGHDWYYPACENSKLFTELTKTKSLTKNNIRTIKKLGFKIIIDNNEVTNLCDL